MSNKPPVMVPIWNIATGQRRLVHRVDVWDYRKTGQWQLTPPGAAAPEPDVDEAAFEEPAPAAAPSRSRAKRLQQAIAEDGE